MQSLLLLLIIPLCHATITVMDSGKRFASKQDANGKRLWKGYEYYARLQYLEGNMALCPGMKPENRTLIPPEDGIPVALLARGSGCTLKEKADYILNHIQPEGAVRYLILDGAEKEKEDFRGDGGKESQDDDFETDTEQWEQIVTLEELSTQEEGNDDEHLVFDDGDEELIKRRRSHNDHADIPFYILHVSFHTEYDLLEILNNQSDETKASGGPRIIIDGRLGTSGFFGTDAAVWIAVCAMVSACACSFILIVNGYDEPEQNEAPARPVRRRLTREQVRDMFPVYRFDGSNLHLIPRPPLPPATEDAEQAGDQQNTNETAGLIVEHEQDPPQMCADVECSICLDEYEAGDKVRVLPCDHVFHSRCIGKWLAERSATCPLCKTDLYESEDEESSSDEEGEEIVSPMDEIDSWWTRFYQQITATQADDDEPEANQTTAPAAAASVAVEEVTTAEVQPQQEFPRASWWSRMFPIRRPSDGAGGAVETTNMLTEPLLSPEQLTSDEEAPPAPAEEESSSPPADGEEGLANTVESCPAGETMDETPDPPESHPRQVTV